MPPKRAGRRGDPTICCGPARLEKLLRGPFSSHGAFSSEVGSISARERRNEHLAFAAAAASPVNQNPLSAAAGIVVLSAIIAALYFGRDILIPISLSVLLSFAIAPLVRRRQRLGLPRVAAVLFAVLLAFAGIAAFGVVVGSQVVRLAENLPDYQDNILAKLGSLHELSPSGGLFDRASRMVGEVVLSFQSPGPAVRLKPAL